MIRLLLLILLLSGTTSAALAEEVHEPKVTGMYSNMEYNEEGGDLFGIEVYLVYGGADYFAMVQCAGGAPVPPVITPVEILGAKISFTLPEGQPECGISFSGTVSKEGLRGRFLGEQDERWLPRQKGYWE